MVKEKRHLLLPSTLVRHADRNRNRLLAALHDRARMRPAMQVMRLELVHHLVYLALTLCCLGHWDYRALLSPWGGRCVSSPHAHI